jgi:hypothetical protein
LSSTYAQPLQQRNRFQPDSSLSDSSRNLGDISRSSRLFTAYGLRSGLSPIGDTIIYAPERTMYWDETDTLAGFVQTLGNIGKPVRRLRYGLADALYDPEDGRLDPFTGQMDPYWIDIRRELKYMDTRTPFVNVQFAQASRRMQILEVTVSQNVTPWWNALIHYKRRASDGYFLNSALDHYNIYTTQNLRSRNNKYRLMFAGTFQQLKDGINGGIDAETAFNFVEINPLTTSVQIESGALLRSGRNFYMFQQYRFFGDSTDRLLKFHVFTEADGGMRFRQYEDRSVTNISREHYPILLNNSSVINEAWKQEAYRFRGGAGLQVRDFYQEISIGHQVQHTYINSVPFFQTLQDVQFKGHFIRQGYGSDLQWSGIQRIQAYLPATHWAQFQARVPLPVKVQFQDEDSTHWVSPSLADTLAYWNPLRFTGHARGGFLPGTLADTLYQGNTFRGMDMSERQSVMHVRVGLEWRRPDRVASEKYRLLGNYVHLQGFYSRVNHPIMYDTDLGIIRNPASWYAHTGIELSFRFRMARFYLEPSVWAQTNTYSDAYTYAYAYSQPQVYGKTALYYENQLFKKAGVFRFGLDFQYFSDYLGFRPDPASGIFYPTGLPMTGYFIPAVYLRTDAFISAKVKDAVIFLRMLHLNQGLQALQYYTTPYYAMWGRTFSFGVNWTFFD